MVDMRFGQTTLLENKLIEKYLVSDMPVAKVQLCNSWWRPLVEDPIHLNDCNDWAITMRFKNQHDQVPAA